MCTIEYIFCYLKYINVITTSQRRCFIRIIASLSNFCFDCIYIQSRVTSKFLVYFFKNEIFVSHIICFIIRENKYLFQPILTDCRICHDTLKTVSSCPSNVEEYEKASKKCVSACISTNTVYNYHCVRNAYKTKLIEVCAVSKLLFSKYLSYTYLLKFIKQIIVLCKSLFDVLVLYFNEI